MLHRLKDPIEVLKWGIEVVVGNGDVMVGFQEKLDSNMRSNVPDPSWHENVFSHFKQ